MPNLRRETDGDRSLSSLWHRLHRSAQQRTRVTQLACNFHVALRRAITLRVLENPHPDYVASRCQWRIVKSSARLASARRIGDGGE